MYVPDPKHKPDAKQEKICAKLNYNSVAELPLSEMTSWRKAWNAGYR